MFCSSTDIFDRCSDQINTEFVKLPKLLVCTVCTTCPMATTTVLVKSFAHLNGNFFLAFLEKIGKLWKGWTVYRSFHTPPFSKLAPLSQGGHRKSIALNVRNFWPALYFIALSIRAPRQVNIKTTYLGKYLRSSRSPFTATWLVSTLCWWFLFVIIVIWTLPENKLGKHDEYTKNITFLHLSLMF